MVVFVQKLYFSGKSGCIWAKVVVIVQSGFFPAKAVVFGNNCRYSGKVVGFGKTGCIRAKVVVFVQSGLFPAKAVVFGHKWM